MNKILEILYRHQDIGYGDFISKLIPTLSREKFIGIRSPEYKKIIKEIYNEIPDEIEDFMKNLPHKFHEENILHVVLICSIKDYEECINKLEKFLSYVDNWAVSDIISPKIFKKNRELLIHKIKEWLNKSEPYTQRVAMILLKNNYLEKEFKLEYLNWVSQIKSNEYYVNMMIAWLFTEALIKQWDSTIAFLTENKLDVWVHNKIIQKARESYKMSSDQKEYLKSLKRKK